MDNIKNIVEKYNIVKIEPINKGWSVDDKYILIDKDNNKTILRISPPDQYEKRKRQYKMLQKVSTLDINTTKAIDFGLLDNDYVYMIISFIEGGDGIVMLHDADDETAYKFGYEAGCILQKIHSLDVGRQEKTWKEIYQNKIERKIFAIENCGAKIEMQDEIIKYYRENAHIIDNQPIKFCHGDYHLGNMLIKDDDLGIIDFDKSAFADPYDELKTYRWNVIVNKYFQTALINSYFDNKIPDKFWKILKFYTAEAMISQLPWAMQFGKKDIEMAYFMIKKQLEWYQNLELDIPTWYMGIK
ncbi:phosphotransferase [Helcococcus kunzii]|uniref:phosphotransferase n=1 Tax=Helcococcus kunzii TaxID=40091 RepID=UPI001BAEC844|nr:phosphotransferase [Helcococcus kunzii]QUY64640.1 phosphotransferase [Helcococcus kunzii]